MLQNLEAIIFDLDGTMIDSMGIWKQIDIDYLNRFGYELPKDLQKCLEGMCFHDTAIYMKDRFNIDDPVDKIEDDWNKMAEQKYRDEIELKDGVLTLLNYAKAHNIKLGIATSNSKHLVTTLLKARNVYDYFEVVLTGCDTLKSKPDPEVYLTAAKRLNVNPKNCLVFEDVVAGITAGKNAGMKVCAVDDSYSLGQRKDKEELADYFIYSYNDITL